MFDFKDIYEDFFGIEKIERENQKLREELGLTEDFPVIEVKENKNASTVVTDEVITAEEYKTICDKKMIEFFEKIDNLYITDESKNILKKMIEYSRKYLEKIESEYISFNSILLEIDQETSFKVIDIMSDAFTFFKYINQGATIQTSLYNIEKVEELNEIYKDKNSCIEFKDIEGMVQKEKSFKDRFWHNFEEIISATKKYTVTLVNNEDMLKQGFDGNIDILEKVFKFKIVGIKPDVQAVYNEVLEKLKNGGREIDDDVCIKLLDYITVTYPKWDKYYTEYRDKLCIEILFNKKEKIEVSDIPQYEKEKNLDEIFEELNELVGLKKVKDVLQDLVSLIELKNKTNGTLKLQKNNLHMVFLGNPGTGKTTVARMIAGILYELKYIKQNKLIEVSSKDLVAEYVGQTAPKTMAVIEKALGGVLFIDEAYTLGESEGTGGSYNAEAIATLIQAMENHRENLVVIFAGYSKEMQSFLNANSGIVSRIGYTLEFEDYTSEELLKIFMSMTKKSGFTVSKEAQQEIIRIVEEYKDSKNFGNARFIRNVFEKTVIKHASNTRNTKNQKILKHITKEDISVDSLIKM